MRLLAAAISHTPAPTSAPAPGIAVPAFVEIPAIDAASSLDATGLNPDGSLEVPPVDHPEQASWWRDSPRPGQFGPAVILGHVDGAGRPGVFHRLAELTPGVEVLVEAVNGDQARFEVYAVEQYGKTAIPAEKVYGATTGPELRLITCGGSFDHATGHYRDNVVAYARIQAAL